MFKTRAQYTDSMQREFVGGQPVGAKLARDTGASVPERPRRFHRGQVLLPQIPPCRTCVFSPFNPCFQWPAVLENSWITTTPNTINAIPSIAGTSSFCP
ncbi:hypothetical protein B0E42_08545 [Pseudomonas sp. A25(2017)]|nr:hypothetical protein B0E42_08545 [Pseudomonas sp. A25(2017)]